MSPELLTTILDFGSMGLLAGVLYIMMKQSAKREERAAEERAANTKALIGMTQNLAVLSERLEGHATETQGRHARIDADHQVILSELNARPPSMQASKA